jgi:uncharacterized protein (TIGR03067 family)
MKNFLLLTLVVSLAAGCSSLPKSDSATLQGLWKGEEIGRSPTAPASLLISGSTLEYRGDHPDDWCKGTFTLREDSQPKQLVGVLTECGVPDYVGKTVYSIYRIEAGTLTLTGNEPGNPEVPRDFDAPDARKFRLKKP